MPHSEQVSGMKSRSAFTLVELAVVVMILGILAAIAAPRLLGTTGATTDNSARQSLGVVRDAIEVFATTHEGAYPSDQYSAKFKEDIGPHLRARFPASPVGQDPRDKVNMSGDDPLVSDNMGGWMYNGATGEFIINCTDTTHDGSTTYDRF